MKGIKQFIFESKTNEVLNEILNDSISVNSLEKKFIENIQDFDISYVGIQQKPFAEFYGKTWNELINLAKFDGSDNNKITKENIFAVHFNSSEKGKRDFSHPFLVMTNDKHFYLVKIKNNLTKNLKLKDLTKIVCDIALFGGGYMHIEFDGKMNITNLNDVKKYDGQSIDFRENYSKVKYYFNTGEVWSLDEIDVPQYISKDYKNTDFELNKNKIARFNAKLDSKMFDAIRELVYGYGTITK